METQTLIPLLAQFAALLVAGWVGCAAAGRLRPRPVNGLAGARLVAAVLAGVVIGPTVLGRAAPDAHAYLFDGALDERRALEQYREQRADDRATLVEIRITPDYIPIFDAETEQGVAEREAAVDAARTAYHSAARLAIFFPMLVVVLFVAFVRQFTTPRHRSLGVSLAMTLGGALVAGGLTYAVVMLLRRYGWVTVPENLDDIYAAMVALGCAAAGSPNRQHAAPIDAAEPWRWLFEPLLYAYAGAHLALVADFNWLLALAVLMLFGDAKALGAMLADRLLTGAEWTRALALGAVVASGGPFALAVAVALFEFDLITGEAYNALVIAALLTAALTGPLLTLLRELETTAPE